MTRLSGGRDGLEALTPEDFIGHDLGPGDRTGMMALAATEEVGLLLVPDAMRFYEREPGPAGELKASLKFQVTLPDGSTLGTSTSELNLVESGIPTRPSGDIVTAILKYL